MFVPYHLKVSKFFVKLCDLSIYKTILQKGRISKDVSDELLCNGFQYTKVGKLVFQIPTKVKEASEMYG